MTPAASAWDDPARKQDGAVAAGLAAAYVAFALTFRGPRDRFWQRMTATGLTLETISKLSAALDAEIIVVARSTAKKSA